jgi:uncharacterized protein YecE (DUF72 family)
LKGCLAPDAADQRIKIGTAGWSVPRELASEFPTEGTSLSRYAHRLHVAEINSSFHRPHRLSTWQRWHDSVPDHFRFSVKVPKLITHQSRLVECSQHLQEFLASAAALRDKLAVLLVQLPPKLAFDTAVVAAFFADLKARTYSTIVCEPRHPSWFTSEADTLLQRLTVARVAADPALCDAAATPGGWKDLSYWRLHGSPVIYRSTYRDRIDAYAAKLQKENAPEVWCIFDNTASSAGAGDALALSKALKPERVSCSHALGPTQ